MWLIRRVVGDSMLPAYREGQLVLIRSGNKHIAVGDVIIFNHEGKEKLKRISRLREEEVFVLGDNAQHSTDSRGFGWLPIHAVVGRVLWSRRH